MSGKPTKLKKIKLTSVDMVRRGANQEAFINLYKSAGDPENPSAPPDPTDPPNSEDIPQGLWKSIVDAVKNFLGTEEDDDEDDLPEEHEEVEKTADTFSERLSQQEIRDNRWKYQDALNCSIDSILNDNDLSDEEKVDMLNTSIEQFAGAYKEMCAKLVKSTANKKEPTDGPTTVGKSQEVFPEEPNITQEGGTEMKIDKSRFTPAELEQYNALIAKGLVEDDDDDYPETEPGKKPAEKEVEKSAEMHPEVKKALEEMQTLQKSIEMKEMRDIAKKYALLGKKEDELAQTLYDMKKSNPANYDAYVSVLDQSLELVNKSGQFEEIGKSSRSIPGGSTVEKIEGIAKSYQDKDPSLDYNTAIMKAWENHPELMDAYDNEY